MSNIAVKMFAFNIFCSDLSTVKVSSVTTRLITALRLSRQIVRELIRMKTIILIFSYILEELNKLWKHSYMVKLITIITFIS